jgi:hypothetical protein
VTTRRRWSDTVVVEIVDDGNRFGGRVVAITDSTWDAWENENARGARDEGNAPTPGLDPDLFSAGSEPGMSMPTHTDTPSTTSSRVPTVGQTTGGA